MVGITEKTQRRDRLRSAPISIFRAGKNGEKERVRHDLSGALLAQCELLYCNMRGVVGLLPERSEGGARQREKARNGRMAIAGVVSESRRAIADGV